jgi:hypothetical protein
MERSEPFMKLGFHVNGEKGSTRQIENDGLN